MNLKRFVVMALAVIGMFAGNFAWAQVDCQQASCRIVVHISDSGDITFVPDRLSMGSMPSRIVLWQIDPNLVSNWKFVNGTPVTIKNDDSTPREFFNGAMLNQNRGFRMQNRNATRKDYHYTVTVTDGVRTFTSPDPTIANQGK